MIFNEKPVLILINPWIYDFAAYDLWSKPLGLLSLAAFLRQQGFEIRLIDCLDIRHPALKPEPHLKAPKRHAFGTGKFWRKQIPRPEALKKIRRPYHRYGISPEIFRQELQKVKNPTAVLVTSLMTYWYPGVRDAIRLVHEIHPGVPVVLGGTYARLCRAHARDTSGAEQVVEAGGLEAVAAVLQILDGGGGKPETDSLSWNNLPYPAFDLYPKLEYVTLLTSLGCPFHCRYCAGPYLYPRLLRREPRQVLEEMLFWHEKYGVKDFAFYDDALLTDFENHLGMFLEEVVKRDLGLRFHTPNAVHIREITAERAELLYRAGFRTLRLGLETSDWAWRQSLDQKVAAGEFEKSVAHLKKAGFTQQELGAYILAGLPGQSAESVRDTIAWVHGHGVASYLSDYSPLPHTGLWGQAKACSEYDLEAEPLFQNNTILPCWNEEQRACMPELKKMVKVFRYKNNNS